MSGQPQHLDALDRANVVRLARAELKRAIRNREVLVAEVLLGDVPDYETLSDLAGSDGRCPDLLLMTDDEKGEGTR